MTHHKAQQLVKNLYQAVDSKNVDYLNDNISQRIRFRIGNNPAASNKETILDANRQFFSSVKSMKHSIEEVISQVVNKEGRAVDKIVCHGRVDYVRLDTTEYSAVFSTVLEVDNNLITDYLVFADLSGLFID
jgi:ketosteroid isomerase-like protein